MSAIDFAELLSGINGLGDLRRFVRALGFGRTWLHLPRAAWPEALDHDDVQQLCHVGERGGLDALLIQIPNLTTTEAGRIARRIRNGNPARLLFFIFTNATLNQIALASFGASEDLRLLFIECNKLRASDTDALHEIVAAPREGGLALALRHARGLDRSRVTRHFFLDFRAQRDAIGAGWKGLPRSNYPDRSQLALLFLCRLMFLYFLQKGGHLAGDGEYVYRLWRSWLTRRHTQSFYASRIKPLFFGVLNRRPEHRSGAARKFGELPYLNGGLFDRHSLERRHRSLDLPDRCVRGALDDLLQRYRFTTQDVSEGTATGTTDAGIDPEMLGRVFEELMAEDQRGQTGTYFTPPHVVDRLVVRALHALTAERGGSNALRNLRVLDPACGSGAFLLGALNRVAEARAVYEGGPPHRFKRELVEHALHGVDLQDDAALLCALRLWLSLLPAAESTAQVQPLPNLDRRIRQGDSLIDPLDLAFASIRTGDTSRSIARDARVRSALRALQEPAQRYVTAEPALRQQLALELQHHELSLARAWLDCLREIAERTRTELNAVALEIDLFGERTRAAEEAEGRIQELVQRQRDLEALTQSLHDKRSLPFFSFGVHFPEAAQSGFDLVLSNPPWVRAHRWPAAMGRAVRERYEVCRPPGSRSNRNASHRLPGAQVDLSLLFLERALQLLRPGGALALLLPAKAFRSLYAGNARRMLLRDTRLVHIEDHSLDQRSIFKADAFAGAVVAVKSETPSSGNVRVACYQRHAQPLEFEVSPESLSFDPGDTLSPWLLVPREVSAAIHQMRAAGPAIGGRPELPIHRGVFTGANEVLLLDEVEPKLGDHAWIKALGYTRTPAGAKRSSFRALIESSAVAPVLAGADLRAWSYQTEHGVVWTHDAAGNAVQPGKRTHRYLLRHSARLKARTGWRAGQPVGGLFGVGAHTTQPKLAWRDLAPTLEAAVLPATVRCWGAERQLIPLNTIYYLTPPDEQTADLLAACFNSLPVRTFARAIAERAKDAHFRFFGWTIAQIPLPRRWPAPAAERLTALARAARDRRSVTTDEQCEIDGLVACAYGLSQSQYDALVDYDRWLGAAHQ